MINKFFFIGFFCLLNSGIYAQSFIPSWLEMGMSEAAIRRNVTIELTKIDENGTREFISGRGTAVVRVFQVHPNKGLVVYVYVSPLLNHTILTNFEREYGTPAIRSGSHLFAENLPNNVGIIGVRLYTNGGGGEVVYFFENFYH